MRSFAGDLDAESFSASVAILATVFANESVGSVPASGNILEYCCGGIGFSLGFSFPTFWRQ